MSGTWMVEKIRGEQSLLAIAKRAIRMNNGTFHLCGEVVHHFTFYPATAYENARIEFFKFI